MRAYDILSTPENIEETFQNNAIDRNTDVVRFCAILDSLEGCFSIALDGKWGSGKTFFVKQVKMLLDVYNTYICNPIKNAEESNPLFKQLYH